MIMETNICRIIEYTQAKVIISNQTVLFTVINLPVVGGHSKGFYVRHGHMVCEPIARAM